MSSLIKPGEPLDGAAAVRELTGLAPMVPGEPRYERARAVVEGVLPGWFPPREPAPIVPTTADVENDGDRGPRPSRDPLASIDAAAQGQHARAMVDLVASSLGLHVDDVRILVWIARTLPGLEDRCRALKMALAEPVYQPDGSLTPNDFGKATPREHVALGSLLSFVRDWEKAHDPYRGREVDPRAVKGGGE